MKVGITGQQGFIGKHLYNYLNLQKGVEVIEFKRKFFADLSNLKPFVCECDAIVHLAAMNRHDNPQVIYNTNVELVQKLTNACCASGVTPHILFASSTQEENDNLYGQSKKKGRELLEQWAKNNNAFTTGMVIPNVFGPFGKPFYNSVVATFCHQIATGEKPTIHNDNTVHLIYINELVARIHELMLNKTSGRVNIAPNYEIKVSEILEKLYCFQQQYMERGEFPNLASPFDLALFNTFRCYIPHTFYPQFFKKHQDNRGYFVEIARTNTAGQFSFSTTKSGITRGNHFHTRKAERFAVIKGKARIQVRKIDSDEIVEYIIDGEHPAYVDVPIWHTHNITNIGEEELVTLFWINEPYQPKDADTYFVEV